MHYGSDHGRRRAGVHATLNDGFPAVETMTARRRGRCWSADVCRSRMSTMWRVPRISLSEAPAATCRCGSTARTPISGSRAGGGVRARRRLRAVRPGLTRQLLPGDVAAHRDGRRVGGLSARTGDRAPAAAEDVSPRGAGSIEHADELSIDPARVLIAGDSAGGNLAAVAALMCREQGAAIPAGQVLIYPVIEPFFDTESYRKYSTGYVNTRDAMKYYWQQYLDGTSCHRLSGWLAPARAESHAGLPPAVVVTAGFDVLQSEGERMHTIAFRECACRASRLPRAVPRVLDDHAVLCRCRRTGIAVGRYVAAARQRQ